MALHITVYQSLFNSTEYTSEDYMFYAMLEQMRSKDLEKLAEEYFNKAIDAYETGTHSNSITKDVSFISRMGLIDLLSKHGRGNECIEQYKNAIKEEPNVINHYVCLAHAYSYSGQDEKRREALESGLKVDDKNAILLFHMGRFCEATGEYEDAFAYWEASYDANNELPDNLFSKAYLYEKTDKNAEAIKMWEQIVNWLKERGYEVELSFPKRELQRITDKLNS